MKNKLRRRLRIALMLLFSAALVYGFVQLVYIQRAYHRADEIYDTVRRENFSVVQSLPSGEDTTDTDAETMPDVRLNLEELRQINADILGWIWIPDTEISYPLLYARDNETYLNRTYHLEYSPAGSIFIDARNSPSFSDDNTIIYGHNMKNGSMFGRLKAFSDARYLDQHRTIYIFTADTAREYRIFSAFKTDVKSQSYTRSFSSSRHLAAFMDSLPGGDAPADGSALLTLSTCTTGQQTARFVVHAALTGVQQTK